jgi:hypothetical protein
VRAFGRRFLVEALFIVVVALIAGLAGLEWTAIVLVIGLAYLLVVAFELAVARTGTWPGRETLARREEGAPEPMSEPRHVHVLPLEPEPAAQPVLESRPEPVPEPEPDAPPAPEPIPPAAELELVPEPEPEPEPPRLEAVPEPEPEPELEEPEPAATVVALPLSSEPREWNVWELERLVRARAGDDVAEDEARSYLLVYLRDFASAEGTLPADFDELVRESFGELLQPTR